MTSIALAASGGTPGARISTSDRIVPFGESFAVGGAVSARRGTRVALKFRPRGAEGWRLVRELHTDASGGYRATVRARRSGAYRAVPARGRPSGAAPIRVRSRVAFHLGSHHLIAGSGVRMTGLARPGGRRSVQVLVRGSGHEAVHTATGDGGGFGIRWRPPGTGTYTLRALTGKNRLAYGGGSPVRRVTVYRRAYASWYGPGLYGNRTACGQTLVPGMMGVAHKTMPCGTRLTLRYGGRSVQVKVIDRGPFAGNREFDLTEAVKDRLRFPDVGVVLTNK